MCNIDLRSLNSHITFPVSFCVCCSYFLTAKRYNFFYKSTCDQIITMTTKDEDKSLDHVTEQEHDYAKIALTEFNKKNYMGCLQHISKLEKRSEDYKVIHNKHVVEFLKSDTKKVELFQKNINAVFKQFNLKIDKLDDVDHCVMYFNQAALLFHQKQYTQALNIMERVYKFIEPLDDTIGKQIGCLLMELYICGRQMDKAFALLTYFRNNINQVTQPTIKILIKNPKENKKALPGNIDADVFVKKLDVYEIRCNLLSHCLTKSREKCLHIYKDDVKNINGIYLMANQEYLEGNFASAEKMLHSVPSGVIKYSESGESSSLMANNNLGVLYHAQGKPNLACHYFQQALKEDSNISQNCKSLNEKPLHIINGSKYHELIYNLGISLLHAGKATQAFDCLIIAVRRYHRNSSLWLRLAECCISVHRSSNASQFDLNKKQDELIASVIGDGEQRRLILNTSVANETKYSSNNTSYAVPVPTLEFASLCLRNAMLLLPKPPALTSAPPSTTTTPKTSTASSTTAAKTLSTSSATISGSSAKQDALSNQEIQKPLQPFPSSVLLMPAGGVLWATGSAVALPPPPSTAPSAPLSANGVCSLRNAILAASSYVALQLGNYVLALEHAEALLGHAPHISGAHKLLGHLYAAEALVLMDKIAEAIDHLNPANIQDISLELPKRMYKKKDAQDEAPKTSPPIKWIPSNLESALTILKYNIAVAKTIRGQLDQASDMLKQIWDGRNNDSIIPAHIIMLFIYIELQLGHIDAARALVKQYTSNKYRN